MKKLLYFFAFLIIGGMSYAQNIQYFEEIVADFSTADQASLITPFGPEANHKGVDETLGVYEFTVNNGDGGVGIKYTGGVEDGEVQAIEAELHIMIDPFIINNTKSDLKFKFFGPDGFIEIVTNSFNDTRVYHNNQKVSAAGNLVTNIKIDADGYTDGMKVTYMLFYDAIADTLQINAGTDNGFVTVYSGTGNGDSFGDFFSNEMVVESFKWGADGDAPNLYIDYLGLTSYVDIDKVNYKVRFNSDGGTPVDEVEVQKFGYCPEPADPVKANFIFQGWYKDTVLFDFDTTQILEHTNLVAQWVLDQPADFCSDFEAEDPAWIAGHPVAENYPGLQGGMYYITPGVKGAPIDFLHYVGRHDTTVIEAFEAKVDLTFNPLSGTKTDFKWKLNGPDGGIEVVFNPFNDLRMFHNNFISGENGNILENTKLDYVDGQTIQFVIGFDALEDTINLKYVIDGVETELYAGQGKGGSFGDFYTTTYNLSFFRWGDDGDTLMVGIDNACLNFTYGKYVPPSGIAQHMTSTDLAAYPNPASSQLTIDNLILDEAVTLYDITGRSVRQYTADETRMTINISDLPNGLYFIENNNSRERRIQKFIKQ